MSIEHDRAAREARFHDEAFSDQRRSRLWSSYYEIGRPAGEFYERYLAENCADARVLEYGCGLHSRAFLLADNDAADVTGIDISEVAVDKENERARQGDYDGQVRFRVMDAERLEFNESSFDLVCGTSVIHHLDLNAAYAEISRVLKREGKAIFLEPLGHNPAINFYRHRTPELRTPDEHPLLMQDLRSAHEHFGTVRARFFHVFSLLAVPLRRTTAFQPALRFLSAADRALFHAFPPARRYAWQVAIELSRPVSTSST